MSHCSLLSKNAASIMGYEHDFACWFALWQWEHRCLRTVTSNKVPVQVRIRGFSAGSYSGLSMCHILWRMQHVSVRGTLGGISLPPVLLSHIPGMQGERLLLYHYTNDSLCQWKPGPDTPKAPPATMLRSGHFGSAEHSYMVNLICGDC